MNEKPPYHREFVTFESGPLSSTRRFPEFPNSPVWPEALRGRTLVWRYEGASAESHRWRFKESAEPGYEFIVWGERIWKAEGLEPDALSDDQVNLLFGSAIGRRFIGPPDPPTPGVAVEIDLQHNDFVAAGVARP